MLTLSAIGAGPRFRADGLRAHNRAVTDQQLLEPCPQCGSAAAVHSISELAAMAQNQLSQLQQGYPAGPQQGYAAEPRSGPVPGYAAEPRSGPLPGSWRGRSAYLDDNPAEDDIGQAVADIALGAAARFIGRAVSRRVQKTYTERVLPTLTSRGETMLREQIAIAEQHPDIRACLTDKVIFLAGGSRVLPMPNLASVTLEQADALVARLRDG